MRNTRCSTLLKIVKSKSGFYISENKKRISKFFSKECLAKIELQRLRIA